MDKVEFKRKDGTVKQYDCIANFSEGFAAVKLNERWGYIDSEGNEICPIQYLLPYWRENMPFPFSEGYAVVIKGEPYPTGSGEIFCGYINTKGEEVSPFIYEAACNFKNGRAAVMDKDEKWFLINKEFKVITKRGYDEIRPFYNGYAVVTIGGKYGFINEKGEEICPIKYDKVSDFGELGYANIVLNGLNPKLFYYIDGQGKEYYAYSDSNEFYPLN